MGSYASKVSANSLAKLLAFAVQWTSPGSCRWSVNAGVMVALATHLSHESRAVPEDLANLAVTVGSSRDNAQPGLQPTAELVCELAAVPVDRPAQRT